jgi:ribosomal protein S18 acetylase RimI-like enzyme
MKDALTDLSASSLVQANESNLYDLYRLIADAPYGDLKEDAQILRAYAGVPDFMFNVAISARMREDRIESVYKETVEYFRTKGEPWAWLVGPSAEPRDLGKRLLALGLVQEPGLPVIRGMALDLSALDARPAPPEGFSYRRAEDEESLRLFAETAVRGNEMDPSVLAPLLRMESHIGCDHPDFFRYVGFLHGQPVATSMAFLNSGVAGIYYVATIPEARRRGIGAMMTLLPLLEAKRRGYRAGILHATPMGYPVYRKIGFKDCCEYEIYLRLDEPSESA